ncbi:MAG: baseplate J/gp47 family protein [Flavobacteriaceae bacterium]|nr:baseplate J/gp47 family protein [Flavobacteriaceae bacterium]
MAENCKDIILTREGTSQYQRFLDALNPENIELHDFSNEDWVLFAYNFAKHVNFFETNDDQTPSGDWQDLFNLFNLTGDIPFRDSQDYKTISDDISKIISEYKDKQSLTPHLTLFIAFLELLTLSKERFNALTKRHLDFYYKRVLQIEKLAPKADKAHIIFELAKRIDEYQIKEGTQLNAGKDENGTNLVFQTLNELIVNKTKVASIKSLYNDTNLNEIKVAQVANSHDGLGAEFPDDNAFWHPFGYTSEQEENPSSLADASVGFSIASPMLSLQEGERNVAITILFDDSASLQVFNSNELIQHIKLAYSSDKKWIDATSLKSSLIFLGEGENEITHTTSIIGRTLKLVFQLEKDMKPLVGFNAELLEGSYTTNLPIVKISFDTSNEKGYSIFRNLIHKAVKNITIDVSVKGISNVSIENDTGSLKPDKPFFPFTPQPKNSSNFYIDYSEVFEKNWNKIDIDILWKDSPSSFVNHYFAYRDVENSRYSKTNYYKGIFADDSNQNLTKIKNQPLDGLLDHTKNITAAKTFSVEENPDNLIVPSEDHFKANSFVLHKEEWDSQNSEVLLFNTNSNNLHETNLKIDNKEYDINKSGPIKLSLNQSFLHDLFPKIYALALSSDDPDTIIPNTPYTPFAETISLNYTAQEFTDFTLLTEEDYDENRIKIFHDTSFGTYEEHSFLKSKSVSEKILDSESADVTTSWLVTDYCHGGELYIGLEGIENLQNVSILFQILEGSENPEADSFEGNQKVEWSILCNNHWKILEDEILTNQIDNFLQSGIVSFSIPKQASTDNTRHTNGLTWIKAKIHKQFDAVCKVIDIQAQAVVAEFNDNENDLSHLENGLTANTISKLVTRVPQIKTLSQPFNSFGGSPIEEDVNYYRRISERLRHKNRAITIWDYEHLILQEFPEIFKALCLKHTKDTSYMSPGEVTVVVIPDIINKNVFDINQPRVSKATLNKIEDYINKLNTLHVEAKVINPIYEEVKVSLRVSFHKGYDQNFYKKKLNDDISKFLSPWAYDTTKNIAFGVELHISVLIDYIEELLYVDYLEEVTLTKGSNEPLKVVSPSKPGAILVSAMKHDLLPIVNGCSPTPTEEKEICQY